MIKITDLVDSKNFVELQESEMESIRGGNCEYGSGSYSPGSRITVGGTTQECINIRFGPDIWVTV